MLRCADCRAFAHAKCVTFRGSLPSNVVDGTQPPPAPQSPREETVVVDGPPSRRQTITEDLPTDLEEHVDEMTNDAVDYPSSRRQSVTEDLPTDREEHVDEMMNDVADHPPSRQQWKTEHLPTDEQKQIDEMMTYGVVVGPPSRAQSEDLPPDEQNHVDEKAIDVDVTPSPPSIAERQHITCWHRSSS